MFINNAFSWKCGGQYSILKSVRNICSMKSSNANQTQKPIESRPIERTRVNLEEFFILDVMPAGTETLG